MFPKAELCPLLDSAGTTLQRCLVSHSPNSQSRVSFGTDMLKGKTCKNVAKMY